MQFNRKKTTIKNAVWGILNRIIAIIGPFLVRTLIIYELGVDYLGLNSLFSSILQIFNMVDLGFGSAIAFCLYKPVANDDKKTICELLNKYRVIYKKVGFCILCLGICFLPFLKLMINGQVPKDINIYLLYLMYLINSCISYFMFSYKSVLFSAYQREDILSKIYSFLLVLEYSAQIIILICFKSYYLYYLIIPVITVLNNFLIYILSNKYYKEYQPSGEIDDDLKIVIKEKMSGIVISKFCGLTRNTFDSIIISAFIGLNAVAIYSNYYYIVSNISALLVILVNSMRAAIGNSIVTESVEKNHKDFLKFTFLYVWISCWCSICFLCLIQPFMEIWVGKELMFSFDIVILFTVYFLGLCFGDIIDVYSGAAGLWWENRKRTIIEAILNLMLNFILGKYYGVFGIILATIISLILCNFIWKLLILYKHYFTEYNAIIYIKNYIMYVLVLLAVSIITYKVCSLVINPGIVGLVIKTLICVVLPNLLFYVVYRKNKLFIDAKIFMLGIIKK